MKETVSLERPGQRFHNLVAVLERMFAHQDGVTVTSSLRLPDKDTGRLREHDVVIVRHTHHGPNLTAIECRDQGRKVGVPQIEAFAKKCEKTGIHHGIVVAANGFTSTARTKAKALNPTCMDLAEAESFEWIRTVTIIGQFYNFTAVDARVRVVEAERKVTNPSTVYTPDGPTPARVFNPSSSTNSFGFAGWLRYVPSEPATRSKRAHSTDIGGFRRGMPARVSQRN